MNQSTVFAPAIEHTLTSSQLALVTFGRMALNIAYRIIYPLLPFLALRLQVDLQMVSMLVIVQVAASLASPLGGALAAARGQRATMLTGMALFCVGTALCAASGTFGAFLGGYALIGLAVALYQPAAQAYLSARTPYGRRGRALGVLELSWAAAALLGVAPLMYTVERTQSPAPVFLVLFVLGLVAIGLIGWLLPPTGRPAGTATRRIDWQALRMPRVLAMLGTLGLVLCGVDQILVIQGPWLASSFGADEAQLGLVFGMQGIAELVGALGSTLLVDRMGKKRAVVGGFGLMAAWLALLPLSDGNWLLFLPLLFLFGLTFEFSIVSAFPLASGVAPSIRGTVLALSIATNGVGRTIGSAISEPLWRNYGIWANCLLAAALTLAAVLLCAALVHETEADLT